MSEAKGSILVAAHFQLPPLGGQHDDLQLSENNVQTMAHPIPSPAPVRILRPRAVRVVPIKVHKPIPAAAAKEFYDQAHQEGIRGDLLNAVILESHEWHRKWTQQDEQGHNLELLRPYDSTHRGSPLAPNLYGYNPREMTCGAKNPSPEDKGAGDFRKRVRAITPPLLDARDSSVSSLSSESPDPEREQSRRRVLAIQPPTQQPHDSPVRIVRPIAVRQPSDIDAPIRLARPVAVRVAKLVPSLSAHPENIPEHIQRRIHVSGDANLSPLTIPSVASGSISRNRSKQRSVHVIEDDTLYGAQGVPGEISHPDPDRSIRTVLQDARDGILQALAISGGDYSSDFFHQCLETLQSYYMQQGVNAAADDSWVSDGTWLTLTKPSFFGSLGENDNGEPMYTLGRMSFDMFSPTSLICSLQGNFNSIRRVPKEELEALHHNVPKALQEEIESCKSVLRTYNIVSAFTIEPHIPAYPQAPNADVHCPIRGLMTTFGYILPDPVESNRQSVWIAGGRIEPNDDPKDQREWKAQFAKHPAKHRFGEQAKLLAVKLLMGAEIDKDMGADGSFEYRFTRPLGGHGMAYVDTIYVDNSLRIIRGHRGTIFVFSKLRTPEQ